MYNAEKNAGKTKTLFKQPNKVRKLKQKEKARIIRRGLESMGDGSPPFFMISKAFYCQLKCYQQVSKQSNQWNSDNCSFDKYCEEVTNIYRYS